MYGVLFIIAIIVILILIVGIHEKTTNAICISRKRLEGKTVLVTGGTAGIGLEVATDLAHRGARVIVACPYREEGRNAVEKIIKETENERVVFKFLDLGSLDSVRKFAKEILATESRMDMLINNAGVGIPCDCLTADGLQFIMQVNYYGTFLLTLLLLPLVMKTGTSEEPSRVLMTSSVLHNIGQMDINNLNKPKYWFKFQIYSNSKFCLTMFSNELAKRMKHRGLTNVVVNCVDPGAVGTRIIESDENIKILLRCPKYIFIIFFKTPWEGAQTTLHAALDKKAGEVSGAYFKNCQLSKATTERTRCDKSCKILWEESMRLVNISVDELEKCYKPL